MASTSVRSLRSRTFVGLLVAQFFAAFNDQFIHAAGMFYAINQQAMTEAQAISLMPILFYAPWVIFPTIAGYLADRFSKRHTIVFWKFAEVVITLVALGGFWMGTNLQNPTGPWIVLATVFLMGMHSTFFVPAKYGIMPEILPSDLLSKGNGLLESLSFLAIILGTVAGGVLSTVCESRETIIGLVLVSFAVVGAVASLLMETVPAADPQRPFPVSVYGPLMTNLRTMIRSKPLSLAMLGIAFFTFVVVFMRMSIYMHGESRVPRWTELQTSIIVGMTALGIGLGSPLAGWLSGSKIEVGLVPLGGLGMILATLLAALAIDNVPGLIAGIILIGFFTGFYLVPMFTLLQHRAPKSSKGDLLATNNCISVAGAILASLTFFGLEKGAEHLEIATPIPQELIATGTLEQLEFQGGRPQVFTVREAEGKSHEIRNVETVDILLAKKGFLKRLEAGDTVDVGRYHIESMTYYTVRPHQERPDGGIAPLPLAYNKSHVPRYLFVGAAVITLLILVLLQIRLPDLLVRTLLWWRLLGRVQLRVSGGNHLPSDAACLLLTNAHTPEGMMHVLAATDRRTRLVLPAKNPEATSEAPPLWLGRTVLGSLDTDKISLQKKIQAALENGQVVAFPASETPEWDLRTANPKVVPVYWERNGIQARVVFGEPLGPETPLKHVADEILRLKDLPEEGTPTGLGAH